MPKITASHPPPVLYVTGTDASPVLSYR